MKQRVYCLTFFLFFLTALLLLAHPAAAAQMGDFQKKVVIAGDDFFEWFPAGDFNEIDNEFAFFYRISGYLDPLQVGVWMSGINGRRISYNGEAIDPLIADLTTSGIGLQAWAKPAYNPYRNEYMVSFVNEYEKTGWDVCARIIDGSGNNLSDIMIIAALPAQAQHPFIVFNPIRRVYFITWDEDRGDGNDIYGIMLNEDGSVATEEFLICDAPGQQIFTDMALNTDDGSCLITWEDFRNVDQWRSNGDIYGALVSGTGEIKYRDIKVCDDYDDPNEGDQRQQHQTYNSKAKNYFVVWWDERPTTKDGGIYARIINANGEPEGDDFLLLDEPNPQIFCSVHYHEKTDRIFAAWDDKRNADPNSSDPHKKAEKDIYARWFLPNGEPDGPEIPLETGEGEQRNPKIVYNPFMDRFLIAWRNYNVEEQGGGGAPLGGGHISEAPGNVEGIVYGMPAFLTGRVVDEKTSAPLSDASVMVLGIGVKATLQTNAGGWFTLAEQNQRTGWYVVISSRQGYRSAIHFKKYDGTAIDMDIRLAQK